MQIEVTTKVRYLLTRVLSDPDDATGVMADLDREAVGLGLSDAVLAGVDVDSVALEVLRTFGVAPTCAHRARRLHAVAPLDATPTDALHRAARAVHDAAGRDAMTAAIA